MLSLILKLIREKEKKMDWNEMEKKEKLEYFLFLLFVSFSGRNEIYFFIWEFK